MEEKKSKGLLSKMKNKLSSSSSPSSSSTSTSKVKQNEFKQEISSPPTTPSSSSSSSLKLKLNKQQEEQKQKEQKQEKQDEEKEQFQSFNESKLLTSFPKENKEKINFKREDTFNSEDYNYNNKQSNSNSNSNNNTSTYLENYKFPILKNDPQLKVIGDRMRTIHQEYLQIEELKLREYTKTELPILKNDIKLLEKEIEMLKQRASFERNEGPEHVESLAADITKNEHKILDIQSKLHFPFSNFVMGSDGLYTSCSDLWVENISGRIEIGVLHSLTRSLTTNSPSPSKLSLNFLSTDGSPDTGLTIKLRVTDFKLKSETSTIPSMNLSELRLDIVVKIRATVTYLVKEWDKTGRMGQWICPTNDFNLEVVTFLAPISLDRRLISALLKPQLMKIILNALPPEFGDLISPIGATPTECSLQGTFSLIGTKMDLLSRKMVFSDEVCQLVSCTPIQLAVFRFMQKSVNTPSRLKTMDDVIDYIRKFGETERWIELCSLWQQALNLYLLKLRSMPSTSMSHSVPSEMIFQNLLNGANELMKKRVQFHIHLSHFHFQVSTRRLFDAYFSWKDFRVENDSRILVKKGLLKLSSTEEYCRVSHVRRRREHIERSALLTILCTFLSSLKTDTHFRLHSGDEIAMAFNRVSATLPVVHLGNFPVNPFSTTLPLFAKMLLKKFTPTETEAVIVSMADQDTIDLKVHSSIPFSDRKPSITEQEESSNESIGNTTPLKSMGDKIKSLIPPQAVAPINNYINEATSKAGAIISQIKNVGNKESPPTKTQKRRNSVIEDVVYTNPPLLHLTLSGLVSELALSQEWGKNTTTGSIRPGQTLFSVEIDDHFRPNQLTLDTRATIAYKMIAQCTTRPIISEVVRRLPEIKNGTTTDTIRTVIGGWPVCMRVNELFRVGVDIRSLGCVLNLPSTLNCLHAYVSNPEAIRSITEINEETLANLHDSFNRINKYLSREGVDVDTSLTYNLETITITDSSVRKRFGGAEEDIILTITSTDTSTLTTNQNTTNNNNNNNNNKTSTPAKGKKEDIVTLRIDIEIWDLVEDMMAISKYVKTEAPNDEDPSDTVHF